MKEMLGEIHKENQKPSEAKEEDDILNDLLMDDEEAEEIMERMKKEKMDYKGGDNYEEKQQKKQDYDVYGEYDEITEDQFLPTVTKKRLCVVHFYHRDFERCKIMDMHLSKICINHGETKFVKLDSEKSPFFVSKLQVKTLPTLCCFIDGVLKDRVVGFDDMGGTDQFQTLQLIRRLVQSNAVIPKNKIEKTYSIKTKSKKKNICYGDNDDSQSDEDY